MQVEYIEREQAIAAIKKDVMGGLNYQSILNSIPAADVQPVVMCKDCLHSKLNEIDNESYICKLSGNLFAPNFYCASGGRKDGGT